MIEISNVSISRGGKVLLESGYARMQCGELCALIGRNGAGKSSLLSTLAGISGDYSGQILINGRDLKSLKPMQLSMNMAYVGTWRQRVGRLTCREVVEAGRAPHTGWFGRLSAHDRHAVDEALETVCMTDYASRLIDTLSDGERQRIMVARALAQDTQLIILDEPTSFLDVPGRIEITQLLSQIATDCNKAVLYSTHEISLAMRYAAQIMLLHDSSLQIGSPAEMERSGILKGVFGQ